MLDGVSVIRSEKVKDELVVDGNDIELVSRSCALINQVSAPLLELCLCASIYEMMVLLICCSFMLVNRNAMSRTRTSVSSSTVSMSVRRGRSSGRNDFFCGLTFLVGSFAHLS